MSDAKKRKAPKKGSPVYIRFYVSRIVILAVGLLGAALVYPPDCRAHGSHVGKIVITL